MSFFFVNQSCGPLFIDIVNEFANQGYEVKLITGEINSLSNTLNKNINVIKFNKYNRETKYSRLISWFYFSVKLFFFIIKSKRNEKWLLSTNPPFAPWLIKLLKHKKCDTVLLVYDIYPDVLKASNILNESNIVYKLWNSFTRNSYRNSNRIVTIGSTMTEIVLKTNSNLITKIVTIPNWNVLRFAEVNVNENRYKTLRGSSGKVHILYSGNLGATHDFKTLLSAAEILKDNSKIIFTIIGEGYQKDYIKNFIKEKKLINIIWESFKPAADVAEVFLSADIFIITLSNGVENSSIPSKTYDALASGASILLISPKGSEVENLIEQDKCGECFRPGDVNGIVEYLKMIANNPSILKQYKSSAKDLSLNFTPENAKLYINLFNTSND